MQRIAQYIARLIVPWMAAVVGLCILYLPTLASGFRLMQNDLGDTRLELYILEHSFLWLTGAPGHTEFWNPPIFYPVKNAAAFTDILLGAAPFYWIPRFLTIPPDTSFQLWMITMALMNFAVFFRWTRQGLGFSSSAATLGAFLFAFAGPRGAQASHPQLLPHFFSVLALLALTEIFKRPAARATRSWIWVFSLSCVLELYSAYYLGWLLGFGLMLATLLALANKPVRRRVAQVTKTHWTTWALALLTGAALLYPMAAHYLDAARVAGYRPYDQVMPPRIQSWLYQGGGLYAWQDQLKAFRILSFEQRQGLGWVTWTLVALGLWRSRKRPWVGIALGVGALAVLLTSEFYPGVTFWRGLYHVLPGAKAIRALSRVSLLVLIPAGLGLAAYFDTTKRKGWVLAGLAILVAIEQIQPTPSFDKLEARAEASRIAAAIPNGCASFYYASRAGTLPEYVYQLDAVFAGLERGVPTLNGYSGTAPPLWRSIVKNIVSSADDEAALKSKAESWMRSQGDSSAFCWVSLPAGPGR